MSTTSLSYYKGYGYRFDLVGFMQSVERQGSISRQAGRSKKQTLRIINKLVTDSSDSGGNLAQAETVTCIRPQLPQLFVVLTARCLIR